MKTWIECCDEVGFTRDSYKRQPEVRTIYYGYRNGESKKFDSRNDALKFSKIVESASHPDDQIAHEKFWKEEQRKEALVFAVWEAALNEEFSELNSDIFDLCYSRAYDAAHSDGHDSVYYKMVSLVDFTYEILKTVK